MEERKSKRTAVVALMAVFSLATCFIILGAISEEIKVALSMDNAQLGSLVSALFLTSLVVQLIIGPMLDKFGHKPLAIVGFLVVSGSMFLLAAAASFPVALFACILLGIGAMCLNTVGNTLIPVVLFEGKDPARASNFGNAFFGMGYVLTPLLFSLFGILALGYRVGVSILGFLLLIFLLVALTTRYPQVSTGYQFSMAIKLLGQTPVWLAALALFCYMSLEVSMGTWIKPYMTTLLGGSGRPGAVANAGLVLSFFGVAMMLGRFISSAVKNLTSMGTKLIAAMSLVSCAAILVMILAGSPALAILAVLITGLAFAPIFPTIVGVTFAKFEPGLYGSIFGIIFAGGLLGATVVPRFIGSVSKAAAVDQFEPQALVIAVVIAMILFLLSLAMARNRGSS
jgi:fucose permease